jgi:hypothetical protein
MIIRSAGRFSREGGSCHGDSDGYQSVRGQIDVDGQGMDDAPAILRLSLSQKLSRIMLTV